MYNILSSIVTSRMPHHIDAKKIILNELKGKASNTYGSTDQLIINKKVMYNLKTKTMEYISSVYPLQKKRLTLSLTAGLSKS